MAAMAILAALRYRDKTGVGQKIDVAQLDTMFAYNVVKGTLTPGQTRAATEALREIGKVRSDEAVLNELQKLNAALDQHDGKGEALLTALENLGDGSCPR